MDPIRPSVNDKAMSVRTGKPFKALESYFADLQVNRMTQMPTLPNTPTHSIASFQNRNLNTMPRQNVRASQPGKPSTNDSYTNLF